MVYNRIRKYATQLLEGAPAEEVIAAMKKVFLTDCSLKNYMSRVRMFVLDSEDSRKFHVRYEADLRKLRRMSKSSKNPTVREAVDHFIKLPFKVQFMRRKLRNKGIAVTGDDVIDTFLSRMHFVAPNINEFRTDQKHARECRRVTEQHRLFANENLKVIDAATERVGVCRAILAAAAGAHRTRHTGSSSPESVPRVAIALLVVSGRRTAEILNCKSIFEPGRTTHSTIFTGQLKTQLAQTYEIPLLCTYADFRDAYAYVKHRAPLLESSAVNTKYASNLGYWSGRLFGKGVTPHDLRRLYASYVYVAYGYSEDRVSTNAVIKWLLGHSGLGTSLNYTGIVTEGISEKFNINLRIPLVKSAKD